MYPDYNTDTDGWDDEAYTLDGEAFLDWLLGEDGWDQENPDA